MTIHVAQCLCQCGHCVFASAFKPKRGHPDNPDIALSALRRMVTNGVRAGDFLGTCALCGAGSETWTYVNNPTDFRTLDQANDFITEQMEKDSSMTDEQEKLSLQVRLRAMHGWHSILGTQLSKLDDVVDVSQEKIVIALNLALQTCIMQAEYLLKGGTSPE